jgi:hypothetical protein
VFDEVGTIAGEHIDHRNLNHGVASGLETHRGASHVNQNLTREGRVVDAHVELQALVLSLAAHTLANEIHTMTHVANIIY